MHTCKSQLIADWNSLLTFTSLCLTCTRVGRNSSKMFSGSIVRTFMCKVWYPDLIILSLYTKGNIFKCSFFFSALRKVKVEQHCKSRCLPTRIPMERIGMETRATGFGGTTSRVTTFSCFVWMQHQGRFYPLTLPMKSKDHTYGL